ncbi:MAG TPA: hypothetical protein VJC16_05825 [Candidatus Nanoarchaeia archaeon]|nr:hypothetical protein [Candidatus Nanoarchaeia archaeon]
MNKQLMVMMALGLMLMASASAVAAPRISRLLYTDDFFHVTVSNRHADPEMDVRNLEDMSVRVLIPELGIIYRGGSFDVDAGDSAGQYVLIDEPLTKEYVVRVTVSNDEVRRVRHVIVLP